MSKDLNLKKSWHPGLFKNQEAVWKREQEAIDERKKILERQKEIQREREQDDLIRLQEAATGKKRIRKLEWMYSEANGGTLGTSDEKEAYLLGKKKIDLSMTGNKDGGEIEKERSRFENVASSIPSLSISHKDIVAKIREDPMVEIKRRQIEAAQRQAREKGVSERTANGSRRLYRDRDLLPPRYSDDEDYERGSRRRREMGDDRSRSDSRDRSRRECDVREREGYKRPRWDDRNDSRRCERDEDQRRPLRDGEHDRYRQRDRHSAPRRDSRRDHEDYDRERRNRDSGLNKGRDSQRDRHDRYRESRRAPAAAEPTDDDRSSRLAAMMANARDMDVQRDERLKQMREHEERRLREDERLRKDTKALGGTASFLRSASKALLEKDADELRRRSTRAL